ncbi:MAG: bacteriohemerythrin [Rhodospirillales bacterium]|nr:bacteriohemerythrin [Rhodospirillales bacterium]MCW8862673.1 bacteriohemerythrin [Rhodospirillales bacterium]MCW8951436.1 bacteriohemerythrin [Rhodospirillales bacterium]MCW8970611.1 bacteriohemerythrin [Rhodospirillales bacterium]MCW9002156.1 bacteriohemerythrin [Rhodospirillales bacterium]
MAFFEWNDSLSVGVSLVDEDHKLLIDLVNQMHDSIGDPEERATLGTVLATLIEYTKFHFAREEGVMEACGYPMLDKHREEHAKLTQQVDDLEKKYKTGDAHVGDEVMDFLKRWLTEHIMKSDTAFVPAVKVCGVDALKAAESIPRIRAFSQKSDANSEIDWASLCVLIVDDNVNFRKVTRTIFETVTVKRIEEAENGAEALELLREFIPDLIICDWRMDEMDGIDFVRSLRNGDKGACCPDVPVVMMTGFGDDSFKETALSAGVTEFLEKPITARGLLMSVMRALSA